MSKTVYYVAEHISNHYLRIILQIYNLVQALVIQVVVVASARDIGEPEGLEHDTEEPGQQDVTWHQPGQLSPVLFALANHHFRLSLILVCLICKVVQSQIGF